MEDTNKKEFNLTPDLISKMGTIVSKYETKRAALLPILNLVQGHYGFLSLESEEAVAEFLDLPLIQVEEVVSFYTLFRRQPKGRCHIQVCRTMSCSLRGGESLLDYLKSRLGIDVGQTSPDGRFSLETVECLGACETAPMLRLNDTYIGNLTKESIDRLIEKA